jgi:dihydroorotate dehydrogenase
MQSDSLSTSVGGLQLSNPLICGAGEHVMTRAGIESALASGVAGVVAKSVNESAAAARQLDCAEYAWLTQSGSPSLFCRSGLAQVAPEQWFGELAQADARARANGQFVAASIVMGDAGRAADLAALVKASGLQILELNVGAPHASEAQAGAITKLSEAEKLQKAVRSVKDAGPAHLWLKFPWLTDDVAAVASAARDGGADAITFMSRPMAFVPDLGTLRPLLGTFGSYGGGWALPIVCRALALARRALGPSYPLIATNGARTAGEVIQFVLAGASAVQVASLVWQEGYDALARVKAGLAEWLAQRDHSISDLVGVATDRLQSYHDVIPNPGRWRAFVREVRVE